MVANRGRDVSNPLRAGRVVTYAWIILKAQNPVNRKNKGAGGGPMGNLRQRAWWLALGSDREALRGPRLVW